MSPNFERSGTVHCFLGNILMRQHHSKWNKNRKESLDDCNRRVAYDSYPMCLTIRHTCKSRLARFVCEYWWKCQWTHKDTLMSDVRLKQIELALFIFLFDGRFVFCDVAAEISAQVMVRRQITRSVCRISPVVGMGLPVESTLVVSPVYIWAAALQTKWHVRPAKIRLTRTSAQSDQSLRSAHSG